MTMMRATRIFASTNSYHHHIIRAIREERAPENPRHFRFSLMERFECVCVRVCDDDCGLGKVAKNVAGQSAGEGKWRFV